MWLLAVTGQIWPGMTTWGDIRDLPTWPGLARVRVEKRAASFNTFVGTVSIFKSAPESLTGGEGLEISCRL